MGLMFPFLHLHYLLIFMYLKTLWLLESYIAIMTNHVFLSAPQRQEPEREQERAWSFFPVYKFKVQRGVP